MTIPLSELLDELVVEVSDSDMARQQYRVQVTLEGDRIFSGTMSLADYHEPPPTLAVAEGPAYGLSLFNRLFNSNLASAFHQAWAATQASGRQLRFKLWLKSNNPLVHRIPWELMHFDLSGGLAPARPIAIDPQIAFSRYLDSNETEGKPLEHRPIRILVAISSPNDLASWGLAAIDKESERRDFASRFKPMIEIGQLEVDFLPRASEEQLHRALERHTVETGIVARTPERGYDALLFYGHALHRRDLGSRLLLEDERSGEGTLYDSIEMIYRLRQLSYRLSLAVLVACNTATQSDGAALGGLAADLVKFGGLPAVLAMQRLVEISLARNFTYHLTEYLLRDGVIDVAVNASRRAVFQPDSLSWSTPVLYLRNSAGRLFAPNARLEYLQQILADQEFIRWSGQEFIDTEVITVPLGLDWRLLSHNPDDAPPPTDVLAGIQRTLDLERAQAEPNVVVLAGPPHSGQTTVLQRLTWKLADGSRALGGGRAVGIFVELADYEQQRSGGSRLERLIVEAVARRVPDLGAMLQALFEGAPSVPPPGRRPIYVFLLDGLDDVQEKLRGELSAELMALARRLPDQRFVVSCMQEFLPARLVDGARVLMLRPLSERQVLRYLCGRNPANGAMLYRRIVDNRLLDLAANPALLAQIFKRFSQSQEREFTRNQLLQDIVDRSLEGFEVRYRQGDVARETLLALAWEMSRQHRTELPLSGVFAVMARVRARRDYNLEDLYQLLRDARMLMDVGRSKVRFVQPIIQTYFTALAIHSASAPRSTERLANIIAMCGISQRLEFWQDTIYTLAGMLEDPAPLTLLGHWAIPENSGPHTLLLARSLEALSPTAYARLSARAIREFLDACELRLRADREPAASRRAQIATAMGRLPYPQSVKALQRLLTEKVRQTSTGAHYDYTSVRVAAARGLRTLLARTAPEQHTAAAAEGGRASLAGAGPALRANRAPTLAAFDATLLRLLRAWECGNAEGLAVLRASLQQTGDGTTPERALAAFALGDLATDEDVTLLLGVLEREQPDNVDGEAWEDTLWAVSDALTMFDAELVARELTALVRRRPQLSKGSVEQLVYLAGRVRAQDPAVVRWLFELFLGEDNPILTGKAMQSLIWLGKALDSIMLPESDTPIGPVMRQAVRNLAAGDFELALPASYRGRFKLQELGPTDPRMLYLRRKALESLAWIGDEQDLETLYSTLESWPIDLREVWYLTAASIHERKQR